MVAESHSLLCNLRQPPFPPWAFISLEKDWEFGSTVDSSSCNMPFFPPLVLDVTSEAVLLKVWFTSLQIHYWLMKERACVRI